MSAPSKKKQAQMAERRNKALEFMQGKSVTVNDIAKHLGLDSLTVNHTVRILIYGGAVEHDGHTYIPNCHGKKTKVCKYKLTGQPFDLAKAKAAKVEAHTTAQAKVEPHVRPVRLLDKPARRCEDAMGSGHHRVFIGSGRGWA